MIKYHSILNSKFQYDFKFFKLFKQIKINNLFLYY